MMKNRSDEFTTMQDYVQVFSEKLGAFERISDRIWREQNGGHQTLTVSVHLL